MALSWEKQGVNGARRQRPQLPPSTEDLLVSTPRGSPSPVSSAAPAPYNHHLQQQACPELHLGTASPTRHDIRVSDTHRHATHTQDRREHPGKVSDEVHATSGREQVPETAEALSQLEGQDGQGFGIKSQT